jgi:hypothetical protein
MKRTTQKKKKSTKKRLLKQKWCVVVQYTNYETAIDEDVLDLATHYSLKEIGSGYNLRGNCDMSFFTKKMTFRQARLLVKRLDLRLQRLDKESKVVEFYSASLLEFSGSLLL